MTEIERIVDQIHHAFAGPCWHGPSVMEALSGVTAQTAARRPIQNAHSIWELVHHIGAWADIPRRRLLREAFDITDQLNFPPVADTSEAAWQESLNRLSDSQTRLIDVVRMLSPDRLDEPVVTNGPTVATVLYGIAHHHIYHAGQIVLLKK